MCGGGEGVSDAESTSGEIEGQMGGVEWGVEKMGRGVDGGGWHERNTMESANGACENL